MARLLLLLPLIVLFAACGDDKPDIENDERRVADRSSELDPSSPTFGVYNAFKAMRIPTEVGGEVKRPFFDDAGRELVLGGRTIELYEFDSKEETDAAAAKIGPDGSVQGAPAWPMPAHFYRTDRVIILYLGSDADVIARLTDTFGKPFAGPVQP